MTRRRARAVLKTELPILASRVEDFGKKVESTVAFLPGPDSGALARLAMIAQIYHDGRRMNAQKVARPDCRKSLEALANLAGKTCEVFGCLPDEHRQLLGRMMQGELPRCSRPALPTEIGRALVDVTQIDLRLWVPRTTIEFGRELDRFAKLAGELARCCSNLPLTAEWWLIELQLYAPLLPSWSADGEYLRELCDTLCSFSRVASELMKFHRGPPGDTVQMRAVLGLKDEFERTGSKVSHTAKDKTSYSPEATTRFGLFVHEFFAGIDPGDTQHRGLNDAIAFACWPCRSSARQQRVQSDVERHQSQIIELLKKAGVTNYSPDR